VAYVEDKLVVTFKPEELRQYVRETTDTSSVIYWMGEPVGVMIIKPIRDSLFPDEVFVEDTCQKQG
jgi:hypothetical protein